MRHHSGHREVNPARDAVHNLTIEQARQLARALIAAADEVEAISSYDDQVVVNR